MIAYLKKKIYLSFLVTSENDFVSMMLVVNTWVKVGRWERGRFGVSMDKNWQVF